MSCEGLTEKVLLSKEVKLEMKLKVPSRYLRENTLAGRSSKCKGPGAGLCGM